MRAGWNPTRRNRNIGTAKRGHGQNNRLVIPEPRSATEAFWVRLDSWVEVERRVHGRPLAFLVEPARSDFLHPCTPDDVARVLAHLSAVALAGLTAVVLRQPRRKERILSLVWGRLVFFAEIGRHRGAMIVLEATDLSRQRWPRSLGPSDQAELEWLRTDGHTVEDTGRGFIVQPTAASRRQRSTTLRVSAAPTWCSSCPQPRGCGETPLDPVALAAELAGAIGRVAGGLSDRRTRRPRARVAWERPFTARGHRLLTGLASPTAVVK